MSAQLVPLPYGPDGGVISAQFNVNHDIRRTELGNCELFVREHGADVRYCHTSKSWLVWDQARWKPDTNGEVVRRVKETLIGQYRDSEGVEDIKHATRSLKVSAMMETLRGAQSELPIAIAASDLDTDGWLLNVANGTIDLRSGKLRRHDRKDLITKLCPYEYREDAKCPRWIQFLNQVFASHPDLIPFMQRAVGYSLTGDVREECLFLMYGDGRNGKGVFIRTIMSVLGDYAGTTDFATFLALRDEGRPRDGVANMRGQRFVSSQESPEGAELSEALIKGLTGSDLVRARRLYENSYVFLPTAKIWMATNHKPRIKGMDTGIWSRLKLLPFVECFEGREDRTLKDSLRLEGPGILAWAVRGCLDWLRSGLAFPDSVLAATAEYRKESDQVGRFIEECCERGDAYSVRARSLYLRYRKWATDAGEALISETAFGRQMPRTSKRAGTAKALFTGAYAFGRTSVMGFDGLWRVFPKVLANVFLWELSCKPVKPNKPIHGQPNRRETENAGGSDIDVRIRPCAIALDRTHPAVGQFAIPPFLEYSPGPCHCGAAQTGISPRRGANLCNQKTITNLRGK